MLLFFVLYDLIELLHNQIQIVKEETKNYAIAFSFSKHGEEVKVVYKSRLKKTRIPIIAKKVTGT